MKFLSVDCTKASTRPLRHADVTSWHRAVDCAVHRRQPKPRSSEPHTVRSTAHTRPVQPGYMMTAQKKSVQTVEVLYRQAHCTWTPYALLMMCAMPCSLHSLA